MYLHPIRFLWKQFNGPQIRAIMTAVFQWVTGRLNPIISYITELSLKTANDSHLSLLGALMGVSRPIVHIASAYEFLFTSVPESEKSYGVSAAPGPLQVGGIFSDLIDDVISRKHILCPTEFYRAVLQACASSSAEPFTPVYLDDALYSVWSQYHPDEDPTYTISWFDTQYPDQSIDIEDIQIDLGPLEKWGTQETAVIWQAVWEGIINNVWGPTRRCQVTFS